MAYENNPTIAHRRALLEKLQSVVNILNDREGGDRDIPLLRHPMNPSAIVTDRQLSASSNDPTDPKVHAQPMSFKAVDNWVNSDGEIDKASSVKMENPFLPRHIRARLHSERRIHQSIESATAEKKHGIGSPSDLHNSIIDNLIESYLPIIEADLRRRLKKTLALKEIHDKTQ